MMEELRQALLQAERRRIMIEERRLRTYHGHAQAAVDDERQGRFATLDKATVTGQGAGPIYPQMPDGNPWATEPIGTEPPLGIDINAQDAVGEIFEQAASDTSALESRPSMSTVADNADVIARKFPRR